MPENILIVYYTHSWNTEKVAKLIAKKTGGRLHQVEPETDYPTGYNELVQQVKKEIQQGYIPVLKHKPLNLEPYDTIFIGTPNWCNTMAPPITAFLKMYNLSGKTVIPFCTHGGGGAGQAAHDMKQLCPEAEVLRGLAVYGAGDSRIGTEIEEWLQDNGCR